MVKIKTVHVIPFFSLLLFIFTLESASLVISQAGSYSLGSSITYTPATTDRIIYITTNNVTLDLNSFVIAQSGGAGTLNGVEIAAGVSNVIIKNGTIQGTSGAGVLINSGCRDISLENITTFTTNQGIVLSGTTGNTISNCTFNNITIRYATNQGILCNNSSLISLSDIVIDTSATTTFALQFQGGTQNGISLDTCIIKNCGLGVQILSYDSVFFNNCSVNNCSFTGNFKGFYISAASGSTNVNQGIVFQQCSVGSCSATGSLSGFEVTNTFNANFTNCTVSNCTGATATTRGFLFFQSQNIGVNNCLVQSVRCTAGTPFASGFEINSSSNFQLRDCTTYNTGQGTSYGAYYLTSATQCHLQRCLSDATDTATVASGFFLTGSQYNILQNCSSTAFNLGGFDIAAGALSANETIISGCQIIGQRGFNINGNNCLLVNCIVNGHAGSGAGFANTTSSGTTLRGCIASNFNNGFNFNNANANAIESCYATNNSGRGFVAAAGSASRFYNNVASLNTTSNYSNVSQTVTSGGAIVMGYNLDGT